MVRGQALFCIAFAAPLAGCGASVAQLVQQGRPEEGLCRVSSAEEARVATVATLQHVHVDWKAIPIRRSDVPALDEAIAKDFFERFFFSIVQTRGTDGGTSSSHDGLRISALPALFNGRDPVFLDGTVSAFTSVTGEPGPTYVTQDELVAAPLHGVDILTLGLSRMFKSGHMEQVTRVSPDYDAARDAPQSLALSRAFQTRFGAASIWFAPRRITSATVALELYLRYSEEHCDVQLTVKLAGDPFDPQVDDWPVFQPFSTATWIGDARLQISRETVIGGTVFGGSTKRFDVPAPDAAH